MPLSVYHELSFSLFVPMAVLKIQRYRRDGIGETTERRKERIEREIELLTRLRRRRKTTPDLRASPETIVPFLFHLEGFFAFPSRQEVSFVCSAFSRLPFVTGKEMYYIDYPPPEIA